MSICKAQLRNISNALILRMSSEQIHLQVPQKLFGCQQLDDQAVNSRLLVRPATENGW